MKCLHYLLFFCFFIGCYSNSLNAQYYSTGQDPASVKWRQINTNDYRLIYPSEFEAKAQYLAKVFDDLMEKGGYSLGHTPRKFSVVFHTRDAISNGMVAWAPKRMEVYTTPPQDNYAQPWLDQVATHEFRHVVQMDKINQGFSRLLGFFFGQQAIGAVVGMYLPPWFLEGDAVSAETALSRAGRGRLPLFEQELKAQLLERGAYSYDKAVLGSYRDFVPDRYKLGYYLVAKGRKNYGNQLWDEALKRVGRNPLGITPFSTALKKVMKPKRRGVLEGWTKNNLSVDSDKLYRANSSGDGKVMLYKDVMSELISEWEAGNINKQSKFSSVSPRHRIYTGYRYPHYDGNGNIVALKQGLGDESQFVRFEYGGREQRIFVPGYVYNDFFDFGDNMLIWAERKEHIRWEKGGKSILRTYDSQTGHRRRIPFKENLFAPDLSYNAVKIVAVEVLPSGENSLVVLWGNNGEVLTRIKAQGDDFFMTPQWIGENNEVVMVVLNHKGKRIVKMDLSSGKMVDLLPASSVEICQPMIYEKYLLYVAAYSGCDNIYALDMVDGGIFQVTDSQFGARDPQVRSDGQKLLYADYNSMGYRVVEVSFNPDQWRRVDGVAKPFALADSISSLEKGIVSVPKFSRDSVGENYISKPYSKLGHLLNIHSWAPMFIDGMEQETDIGLSIASQNKLGTLLATAGFLKEQGYDKGQYYLNFSYRGWFPIIDCKASMGDRDQTYYTTSSRIEDGSLDTLLVNTQWRHWDLESSISLPFNISKGKAMRKIIPKVTYHKQLFSSVMTQFLALGTNDPNKRPGTYLFDNSNLSRDIMEYQLFAYNISKSSYRDVQPRWGQVFELNYRHTPFGDVDFGTSFSGEATFYLPGFGKHHGVKLYGGYQERKPYDSPFANTIRSPRGLPDLVGHEMTTLTGDYHMPLICPDWRVGPFAYFKRIRAKLFWDHSMQWYVTAQNSQGFISSFERYNSFGVELNGDVHLLRFPAPVDMGIRVGFEDVTRGSFVEFLLRIDLSGI